MSEFVVPSREESMARFMRGGSRVAHFKRDMPYTTSDRLTERAADAGDKPFIIFEDRVITFAEANRIAERIGQSAIVAGFKTGDVIALLMENRPEFVLTWLGLAKAGVVTALLNTAARGNVLTHALTTTNAKALIIGTELLGALDTIDPLQIPIWEWNEQGVPAGTHKDFAAAIEAASAEPVPASVRAGIIASNPLYLIFTSGTTGLPKAAKMSHLRFLNSGEVMGGMMAGRPDDVMYCVLPLYHGAGGMVIPSISLAFGIPFVLRRKFSSSNFWPDVRRHKITGMYYIGEIVRYLMNAPPSPNDKDHTLRNMGGAGLRPDIWAGFVERFGIENVFEGLGSTEANYGITNVDNRIGSVGRVPFPQYSNVRVIRYDFDAADHVRDANGQLVQAKPGEVGELIAEVLPGPSPAGFFEGYLSQPETEKKLIRDIFKPGDVWFRSGDLVRFDEEDYYWFVDRVGDTYRWKSENVSTLEVETILSAYPDIAIVNVYGVKVPNIEGRAGMAAVTMEQGAKFDPVGFYKYAAEKLASYAVPVFVRLTEAPDMTTTYKLKKTALQREGFDPANVGNDEILIANQAVGKYIPLTAEVLDTAGPAWFERLTGVANAR
jgi:fatty-acyl-CoA synthase